MKVNACSAGMQTATKVKGAGTDTPGDAFQILLQMLVGGILNLPGNLPENMNLLSENSFQNDKTGMAGDTEDALQMLAQSGKAGEKPAGADASITQNSIGTKPEATSDSTAGGKISANSQSKLPVQNLSEDLLDAIKAASDIEDTKKAGTYDAEFKNENIQGVDKDAQGVDKCTPTVKTILESQTVGAKSVMAALKSGDNAGTGSLTKTGIREAIKNIGVIKSASSGKQDEDSLSSKDGDGQKAVKEYVQDSNDEKAVLKNDVQIFQINDGIKQTSGQSGPDQVGQTGADKQLCATDKSDILNQIYDRIKVLNSGGTSELHVSLKPDQLGNVSIKLVMEKGVINARITVENSGVKDIMETSVPQIKEHLKDQNVNVSHFTVYVGTGQREASSNGNFQQYRWQHAKKVQSKGDIPAVNIGEGQYYDGVLNLLA